MGYLNPVMQFGIENFCKECQSIGIDGVIIPDLPPMVYTGEYSQILSKYSLYNILLISPQSSEERISDIDEISRGFIYMVSSSSVTGSTGGFSDDQMLYFKRVREMNLTNPCLIGFGISDHDTFMNAARFARGGIIGSAFVRVLDREGDSKETINKFINGIR
jgi:tryptophan synthase alpha chain